MGDLLLRWLFAPLAELGRWSGVSLGFGVKPSGFLRDWTEQWRLCWGALPWSAGDGESLDAPAGFFPVSLSWSVVFPSPRRYISILPAIPVTLYLNPQEALEVRHPQEANRYHSFFPVGRGRSEAEGRVAEGSPRLQGHRDVTLYQ